MAKCKEYSCISHLSSATSAQHLLAVGRELLCAKLSFPPSYQKEECVRERSICLFRDVLGKTVWRDEKAMKKYAWKSLVCLLLHMSDQAPGVAKASKEAILAIAELLKWKELEHLAQTEQTWRMGECLNLKYCKQERRMPPSVAWQLRPA
ncbi:maestro heat-like repeat family member 5 [Acridotheres tristis]